MIIADGVAAAVPKSGTGKSSIRRECSVCKLSTKLEEE